MLEKFKTCICINWLYWLLVLAICAIIGYGSDQVVTKLGVDEGVGIIVFLQMLTLFLMIKKESN